MEKDINLCLLDAISLENVSLVEKLLEQGADIWFKNEKGISPLHFACSNGNLEIVKLLLQNGHAWNVVDNEGITAGEYAKRQSHDLVYELLLEEGCRVELILGLLCSKTKKNEKASNVDYLSQPLKYSQDGTKLLDYENNGVMMGWEKPLMDRHAEIMCVKEGLDILNIGFGLGLIDIAFQRYKPRSHTIIEAHPDVYKFMMDQGWNDKTGVKIIHGRWQDVLDQLDTYDVIFFDTFGEFYEDLREFHKILSNILKSDGIYSFFNGLGATNSFFHDVYCRIAEMHLANFGLQTEYIEIPIDLSNDKIWEGVKRRYWTLDTYRLPKCQFMLEL
ncbi:11529_t:CDS:2 [Funneliformis geosporum]|uniref:Arginine N-methyltransferase 2 n=1 Tax=Funneliformis geosporum TaxID=1117311 RepID=A0A9W4T102_9GLOM|nr:9450_t:CDS:2 [Funneliformis geosporum]CAI2191138.1 11529_t:CDS:2 [Funneliformis geosporum]